METSSWRDVSRLMYSAGDGAFTALLASAPRNPVTRGDFGITAPSEPDPLRIGLDEIAHAPVGKPLRPEWAALGDGAK
jgi:hypothetical protein